MLDNRCEKGKFYIFDLYMRTEDKRKKCMHAFIIFCLRGSDILNEIASGLDFFLKNGTSCKLKSMLPGLNVQSIGQ